VSWFLAFCGFALLIILHELGHFTAAKAVGMRVERFSLFFPPLLARKQVGETEYAIGSIPFGGYVKISGMNPDEDLPDEVRTRAYYSQPVWKRITVIAAGPAVNLVLALLLMFVYSWVIGEQDVSSPPNVGAVERAMPAAGKLKAGDSIVSVDGVSGGPERLAKQIQSHKCPGEPRDGCKASTPATVVVKRDAKTETFKITPVYDAHPADDGPPRTRLGFGYAFDGPRVTLGFADAVDNSIDRFGYVAGQTLSLPARLIDPVQRKELSGVVGSYEVTRQTILDDVGRVVLVLAVISLSLAIVNLFPFLPLDGGHIFWAIVEKVRRKPVPFSVMERAGVVGFMLVILIFLIGLSNDIDRLSGEGFGVR
jgi:regulator of sigma E protease